MSQPGSSSAGHNWLQRCFYSDTGGSPEARRATRYYMFWTFTWAIAHVGATWALRKQGPHETWLEALIVAFPLLLSLAMLVSFLRVLQRTDELMRKIQVEALALGFGAMLLLAFGNTLLQAAGAGGLDLDILAALGLFCYAGGVVAGRLRHR